MKKILLLLLLIPTLTNAQTFKIGDKGTEVVKLQKMLGIKPTTGYFGKQTKLAYDKYLASKTTKVSSNATTTLKTAVLSQTEPIMATSTDTSTWKPLPECTNIKTDYGEVCVQTNALPKYKTITKQVNCVQVNISNAGWYQNNWRIQCDTITETIPVYE